MKNLRTISLLFFAALCLSACDKDKAVKEFVANYATAVTNSDTNAIQKMYPDAAKATSLTTSLNVDSMAVTDQDSVVLVGLGKDVDMKIRKGSDGTMTIVESHGLFAYPAKTLAFAKKTGQWKEGLSDAQQAARMADQGLVDYLFQSFNEQVKTGLSIIKTGTYGDDYYQGEWVSSQGATFTVKNHTPFDVPGSAYHIVYKSGYWGGGAMSSEIVAGKPVKAGETVMLRTSRLGPNMESDTSQQLVVKGFSKEEFLANFQPTGKEFDEYLLRKGQQPAARAETLSFIMEGLMGGCGTRLGLEGKDGFLMYTLNSQQLEVGNVEQRDVTLVSYDPTTAQLVLRVKKIDGTVTGNLVGTYRNGTYQGKFNNVNGKSSSFSFK
ncbi:MAG: hypothetical protein J5637_04430 [Prevotella sp.]|nr:hypothetical protein [Prevotella sp.]